jgi:HAD superfamily hydrolase (TIGR01450 family)
MSKITDFKGIVFDMDGVLRIGKNPIKGADKIFSRLEDRAMIVTNECRRTPKKIKEELTKMGIDIGDTPILTSGVMTYNYLYDIISAKENKNTFYNVLTIGEDGLFEIIEELSFLDNYKKITPLFIQTAIQKKKTFTEKSNYVNYLVIGSKNNISIKLLKQINNYFEVFSDIKVIITCPDAIDPENGEIIVPKHLIHILNYNKVEKIVPYHTGKPNPLVTRYIERYFKQDVSNTNPDGDIIFVGDTLETDIKLAKEAFFKSVLVLSGNTKMENLKKSDIEPDIVIDSVDDLSSVIDTI